MRGFTMYNGTLLPFDESDTSLLISGPVVAVDTETTGLRWWGKDQAVVASWASEAGAFATRSVQELEQLLKGHIDRGGQVALYNARFDRHFLQVDIPLKQLDDLLLMTRLNNNLEPAGLKPASERLFGIPPDEQKDIKAWLRANKHKPHEMHLAPDELLMPYAIQDAALTLRHWHHWKEHPPVNAHLYDREMRVAEVMYRSECHGLHLDMGTLGRLTGQIEVELQLISNRLRRMGAPDVLSPNKLRQWLYDDLGLPVHEYTPKGALSTDDTALTRLWRPEAQLLRAHRQRTKMLNYLQAYEEMADWADMLHPSINTLQARTHRMSVSEPPLQQIPARDRWSIRNVFLAQNDGYYIGADFDKQELRIGAALSGDRNLIAALMSGEDVYTTIATTVLGRSPTPRDRNATKIMVLGWGYGAGNVTTASILTSNLGHPYTSDEVSGYRDAYRVAYPRVRQFSQELQRTVECDGVVTNPWGRELGVDRDKAYRAFNYLTQSSGGDALRDAILNTAPFVESWGGHIVLPIHDELWFWLPEKPTQDQLDSLRELMATEVAGVPLMVKAHVAQRAGELK